MAKIQNWSRLQSNESKKRPYFWQHDTNSRAAVIVHRGSGRNRGTWGVTTDDPNTGRQNGSIHTGQKFETQERARRFAIEYMKRNPGSG